MALAVVLLVAGASAAPAAPAASAAPAAPPGASVLFHFSDPRLDEVSGIAASSTTPGVFYVLNDSGDSARFFAVSASTGRVLVQYDVPGATNVDWEDIAVARDAHGAPSVWLADIGDNDARRSRVSIYRVDEPGAGSGRRSTGPPQVWRLRYPDGPADAESLAVSPRGEPYVITKSPLGRSQVYLAPAAPGRAVLRPVATIQFGLTGTPGPFGPLGQLLATGASFSADGGLLAVRTYTDAYVWRVHAGAVARALRSPPTRIALPRQPQGEGICFRGTRLVIDSEGRGSATYAVALPPSLRPPAARPSTPAAGPSATRSTATRSTVAAPDPTATDTSTTQPNSGSAQSHGEPGTGLLVLSGGLLTAIVVGVVTAIVRRKRSGRAGSTP